MPGKFEMPGLLGLCRRCCPLGWSKKQKPVRPGRSLQNWFLLIYLICTTTTNKIPKLVADIGFEPMASGL